MNSVKSNYFINLYNLAWFFLTPFIPFWIYSRVWRGLEEKSRVKERYGFPSIGKNKSDKLIWIHVASLGESVSASALSKGLRENGYKGQILITSGSKTSGNFLNNITDIIHQYHPYDNSNWVKRFLKFWEPDALIMMESEIWPNFILNSWLLGIPVIMVSAQISEKSFMRLKFLGLKNTKYIFEKFDIILTVDEIQTIKFKRLGAKNVSTSETLKASFPPQATNKELLKIFKHNHHNKTIILAASTHDGEEEILLNCVKKLNRNNFNALLIIAPRHVERAKEISDLHGLNIKLKSNGDIPQTEDQFWICDTYGEMATLYSIADIVFMGGSLLPHGGHNPSEPCYYNSSILIGPYTEKCQKLVSEMLEKNALIKLKSNSLEEIYQVIKQIITDDHLRKDLTESASLLTKEWSDRRKKIANQITGLFL